MNRAQLNRKIVNEGLFVEGYIRQEKALTGWALGDKPPETINLDTLPGYDDLDKRRQDVVDWIWRAE